jgi:hypothetical protein
MFATTCPGLGFDTRIFLHEGSCLALSCVTVNDAGCGKEGSSLSWASTAGRVYHIQVTGVGSFEAGKFALRVDGTATLIESQGKTSCSIPILPSLIAAAMFALH